MSEMVERVARAIEAKSNYVISQHHARALARTAIEKMREPIEAMIDAADVPMRSDFRDPSSTWELMIDAALKE